MSAAADDHAVFFEALRRSSAKLLRLNPDSLSAAQSVRVDRCAALRLLLDRFQSQQLAGGEIDAKAFIAASAELERLLGGSPDKPTSVLSSREGRERLRALIERTVLAPAVDDPGEVERTAELMRREEMAAVIAAGGDAVEALPATLPAQLPDNVIPIDATATARANANLPPAHYLKDGQVKEPWERGGTFTVPSWPLPR